jgi:sigma-B regulation protein RsbU (phosphoserine phosphatase)
VRNRSPLLGPEGRILRVTRSSRDGGDFPLIRTLTRDTRRVFGETRRRGFRRAGARTFEDLEAFYLSEERRQRLAGMGRLRRWLHRGAWLLKSLFLNLTPARRVLLALAMLLCVRVQWHGDGHSVQIDFGGFPIVLFLLLLMLELKDKLVAKSELQAGRVVQQALLPKEAPQVAGWDVWISTRPANEVGGDLVDFVTHEDGRIGLVLADVSGKGLPAALLMARLQATLLAFVSEVPSLAALASRLHKAFRKRGLENRFATLVYLELEPGSAHLRLVNAGHMSPLVVGLGHVQPLPAGGPALGIPTAATYEEQLVHLAAGQTLVVYSDGVTDALNEGGAFFGDERLLGSLRETAGRPAAEVAHQLLGAVEAFVGEAPWHDDVSLLVVRRAG